MRNKLIELIIDGFRNCTKPHEVCSQLDLEALADYLIAHGVTIATDTNVGDKKALEIDTDYFKAQEARYLNHIAQGNLFVDNPSVTS